MFMLQSDDKCDSWGLVFLREAMPHRAPPAAIACTDNSTRVCSLTSRIG